MKTLFEDGVDYIPYDDNEEPREFTNLSAIDTGIEGAIRCVSKITGVERHVIYFQNLRIKNEILVVSIPDGHIITDTSKAEDITKQMVRQFVIQNAEILTIFWDEGEDWDLRYLLDTMSNLNKIDAHQFKIQNQ
jgi:hypothetical protein